MLQKGSATVGFSRKLRGVLRVKTEGMFVVVHLESCNGMQATKTTNNAHLDILSPISRAFAGFDELPNWQGKANHLLIRATASALKIMLTLRRLADDIDQLLLLMLILILLLLLLAILVLHPLLLVIDLIDLAK